MTRSICSVFRNAVPMLMCSGTLDAVTVSCALPSCWSNFFDRPVVVPPDPLLCRHEPLAHHLFIAPLGAQSHHGIFCHSLSSPLFPILCRQSRLHTSSSERT